MIGGSVPSERAIVERAIVTRFSTRFLAPPQGGEAAPQGGIVDSLAHAALAIQGINKCGLCRAGKSQVRGLSTVVLTELMHDLQDPLRGLTHPGACPTADESDTRLDWHEWASLSLTEALGDLSFHIVPFDELGATFVELLRPAGQLLIPCLVNQRLVVTFFEAAPQIIGNLLALVWFELKRSIEDFLHAQHAFSLPQATHTDER